jgi:hypothetical protein
MALVASSLTIFMFLVLWASLFWWILFRLWPGIARFQWSQPQIEVVVLALMSVLWLGEIPEWSACGTF